MIKRIDQTTTLRTLVFVVASIFLTYQGYAQAMDQSSDGSPDNCTSIMVGKLASTDGSTITSHT